MECDECLGLLQRFSAIFQPIVSPDLNKQETAVNLYNDLFSTHSNNRLQSMEKRKIRILSLFDGIASRNILNKQQNKPRCLSNFMIIITQFSSCVIFSKFYHGQNEFWSNWIHSNKISLILRVNSHNVATKKRCKKIFTNFPRDVRWQSITNNFLKLSAHLVSVQFQTNESVIFVVTMGLIIYDLYEYNSNEFHVIFYVDS